ncbi:MAG: aminodeoxychorismate/anthranilate synthase component II [Cellvibrionaceae bacterium]
MLLMIDNYDSFTYNVVHYLEELGQAVKIVRNDELLLPDIEDLEPERIVISPGPCTPNKAGLSMAVIERFAGRVPLLGICLGHQCIGQVFGGNIIQASSIMHGKVSRIHHNGSGVFSGIKTPFEATRYHSLVVEQDSLPECFEITAWTETSGGQIDEVMGLRHKKYALEGVQFHPESILSEAGHKLLANFLAL